MQNPSERRGRFICSPDFTAGDFSLKMLEISRSARQKGFSLLQIFGLYQAAEGYSIFLKDCERAFACYLRDEHDAETDRPRGALYHPAMRPSQISNR